MELVHNHLNSQDVKKCSSCLANAQRKDFPPSLYELKRNLTAKVSKSKVVFTPRESNAEFTKRFGKSRHAWEMYNKAFNNARALHALEHFEKAKTAKMRSVWAYVVARHLDFPKASVAFWLGVCDTVLYSFPRKISE
ncbi:MAG TPA: hypothetical protein PLP33_24560 [Leptospiraceae bacterium]|nr:hypothetical protein [Leptospiraceae bacterium]